MSLARRKNSIIAWKMPAVGVGKCDRGLRHLAADIGDRQHDAGDQTRRSGCSRPRKATMMAVKP